MYSATSCFDTPPRKIKVKDNENTKRILFAKSRDELGRSTYKFIGVFLFDKQEEKCNIYKRIGQELVLLGLNTK